MCYYCGISLCVKCKGCERRFLEIVTKKIVKIMVIMNIVKKEDIMVIVDIVIDSCLILNLQGYNTNFNYHFYWFLKYIYCVFLYYNEYL